MRATPDFGLCFVDEVGMTSEVNFIGLGAIKGVCKSLVDEATYLPRDLVGESISSQRATHLFCESEKPYTSLSSLVTS